MGYGSSARDPELILAMVRFLILASDGNSSGGMGKDLSDGG